MVNLLFILHPHLINLIHPTLNQDIELETVTVGTHKKLWWICDKNHEWQAKPNALISKNTATGCPYCSGRRIAIGFNDLLHTHPKVANEWHPSKNIVLVTEVTAGSSRKVWWKGICNHDFISSPAEKIRSGNKGCPYCSGKKVLNGFNDLYTISPSDALELHPTLNHEISADQIIAGSDKSYWWLGKDCDHEWEMSPLLKITQKGCPICANRRVLSGFNDLQTLYPEIALQWHTTKNHPLTPSLIIAGSHTNIWWQCDKSHEWQANLSSRVVGNGCPYCANRKTLYGFNDVLSTHPELGKEFQQSKNPHIDLGQFTGGSSKKIIWTCVKNHDWKTSIHKRALDKQGCPECVRKLFVSKAEQELADFLMSEELEVIQSNRKLLDGVEIDIYLPDKNIAIEYNGLYWHNERNIKNKFAHYEKWRKAQRANIQLIQIWEDDWMKRKSQIKLMLINQIRSKSFTQLCESDVSVCNLSEKDTDVFFKKYAYSKYTIGEWSYGLKNDKDHTLTVVVTIHEKPNNIIEIVTYVVNHYVDNWFSIILKTIQQDFPNHTIVMSGDNALDDKNLYLAQNFQAMQTILPTFLYVYRGERQTEKEYRLSSKQADNLTTTTSRIWDAGSTLWVQQCDRINLYY